VVDAAEPAGPAQDRSVAVRHFLFAVHQALGLPAPYRPSDRLPYLTLLEKRSRLAHSAIGRLIANPRSSDLDYASEGDHILHQIADLPADTYRHQPE
jgi:hypothetical protein